MNMKAFLVFSNVSWKVLKFTQTNNSIDVWQVCGVSYELFPEG